MLSVFSTPARELLVSSSLRALTVAAAVAGLSCLPSAEPAFAQSKRASTSGAPQASREAPRALVAVVSLRNQTIEVYDANGQVTRSSVSSGQSGYETPRGVFSIIQKNVEHFSNLYDDAPMPFMQRITWSGVALHAGNLPGHAASHGCIRLPHAFAEKLFSMTQMGTRVIVTGGSPSPASITHAKLMAPISVDPTALAANMQGIDIGVSQVTDAGATSGLPRLASSGDRPASSDMPAPMRLGVPLNDAATTPFPSLVPASPLSASGRFLDAARADASSQFAAAERKVAAAKADLAKVQRENAVALRATLAAEKALADAEKRFVAAGDARAKAKSEKDAVRAEEAEVRAELAMLAARSALDAAAPDAAGAIAAKTVAENALKSAEEDRTMKAKVARELDRKARPISVFISRKTQRLYIRQGFEPVVDMPVAIQDPSRPIGTHVFTAMTTKFEPASANWHVVTVVDPGNRDEPAAKGSKKGEQKSTPARVSSASAALDRVTIPDAISRQIAESLRSGASIMISDEGISHETGKGTDFVVLAK